MKTFLLKALKHILILQITIILLSCESPDSDNRYESLTTDLVIGVIDKQTSEVYIFDTNKESIAVKEAAKLNIPIIAIVDTNSSLDNINYPIPGNDDSAKAISFFCELFAETIKNNRTTEEKTPISEQPEKTELKKNTSSKKDSNPKKEASLETSSDKKEKEPKVPKKKPSAKEAVVEKSLKSDDKKITETKTNKSKN